MNEQNETEEVVIPQQYLPTILRYLAGFPNGTTDLSKPQLKSYFIGTYPIIVGFYAALIVSSVLANIAMVYHIFRHDLHEKPTCGFLVNIALANIIHVAFPLPLTLVVILMYNWIFGRFMCYFLPLLQDTPTHVLMMTYLLIVFDRYRFLCDPRKPRIPAFVCSLGTWFFAICIVLPYPIYTTFLDLQNYFEPKDKAPHMCMANVENDIHDYMKSLFIGTYAVPLTITKYIYVKSSRELENQENPMAVAVFGNRHKDSRSFSRRGSTGSNDIALATQAYRRSESVGTTGTVTFSNLTTSYDLDELDVPKETQTQKYLFAMIATFAACLCPLTILRLAKSSFMETYENTFNIDITYLILIWVAFLPALTTPCLYFVWQTSRPISERLRGYLQFSERPNGLQIRENGHPSPSSRGRNHLSTTPASGSSGHSEASRSRASSSSNSGSAATVVIGTTSAGQRSPRFHTVLPPRPNSDAPVAGSSSYRTNVIL